MTTDGAPEIGDKKVAPCTWCGSPIEQAFVAYPPHTKCKGGFWDQSACPCGSKEGMRNLAGSRLRLAGRWRVRPRGWHKSISIKLSEPM